MRIIYAAFAVFVLAPAPCAFAQTPDEAVADTLACAAVRGTKARLKCFEASLPALKTSHPEAVSLAASRAGAAKMAAREKAQDEFGLNAAQIDDAADQYERDAFGADDLIAAGKEKDDEVKAVTGTALEVGRNNTGKWFVVLQNGQIWRQVKGDKATPYIPSKAEGLPVQIKKGAFGSYFVKVGKARESFRAERIK